MASNQRQALALDEMVALSLEHDESMASRQHRGFSPSSTTPSGHDRHQQHAGATSRALEPDDEHLSCEVRSVEQSSERGSSSSHTVFVMHVRAGRAHAWVVKARYSQFRAFRSVVKAECPGLRFPGKAFKAGMVRADWERRRRELGHFMNQLLAIERIRLRSGIRTRALQHVLLGPPIEMGRRG